MMGRLFRLRLDVLLSRIARQQMLPLSVGFGTGEMKAGGDLTMKWTVVRDCSKIGGAPQDTVSFVGTKD